MAILDVPHIKQAGETHCGVACLEMVYRFFGITDVSQEDIWKKRKTLRPDKSAYYMETKNMVSDVKDRGFYVLRGQLYLDEGKCSESLQNLLASGIPVIACNQWERNPEYGHFVVIVGLGGGQVMYLDPEKNEQVQKKEVKSFISEWQPTSGGEVVGGEFIVIGNEKERFKIHNLYLTNFWVPAKLKFFYLDSIDFTD